MNRLTSTRAPFAAVPQTDQPRKRQLPRYDCQPQHVRGGGRGQPFAGNGCLAPEPKPASATRTASRPSNSVHSCIIWMSQSTLMSAFTRRRQVNWWLASKRWFWALPGRAGGAVVETTVDHTLMRGSEPHDRW